MASPVLEMRRGHVPVLAQARRRQARTRLYWGTVSALMWLVGIIFALPFVWMIISSLKRSIDVFSLPIHFLLRQFFMTIPQELNDAARIDGASDWPIYWRVILPLAKPVLASLAILAFVGSWNDYETPLVMLTSDQNFTIPLGLTNYIDDSGGINPSLIMAGAVSSLLPVLIMFMAMQRQFIQALARTGLKG